MIKEKIVPAFDNLNDVDMKFTSTICYHKGKAVYIKGVGYQQNPNTGQNYEDRFEVICCEYGRRNKQVKLEDPDFSYRDYNMGYANAGDYAAWYYRVPLKQYRQGLRHDQVSRVISEPVFYDLPDFSFKPQFIDMLENRYPPIHEVEKDLKNGVARVEAFHKDFALSYDKIHEDMVIEYRGQKVGMSINHDLKEFKLLPEFKFVQEALAEALA